MPPTPHDLKIAFYGDDFTGSTDALECLALAGLRTRLFLEVPSIDDDAQLDQLDAIGIAGRTRSLATADIQAEIQPALEAIRTLAPRHIHYKVCSTFDSSPKIGSIGRVIDVARQVLPAAFVPVVVAAPSLGRWSLFGNLFARYGIGSKGGVHRLDRHPAMSKHPSTPASESDLRVHLAGQTDRKIGLVDILAVSGGVDAARKALDECLANGDEVVLFDAFDCSHMRTIGELLDAHARAGESLFSVGSSGVETALCSHWKGEPQATSADDVAWKLEGPLLVVSGSCSPITTGQIDDALSSGFAEVPLDVAHVFGDREAAIAEAAHRASQALGDGRNVIVHTFRGTTAPRKIILETVCNSSEPGNTSSASILGTSLGSIARHCVEAQQVGLTCVAGGDTSSYAAQHFCISSLDRVASVSRGAPVCRIASANDKMHGQLVVFKGGQVGGPNFFTSIASSH